jgi:predicted ATPase
MPSTGKVPNWYVVTGVPSSGISTLVSALRPYVDKTFPEAARMLIDRNLKRGIPVAVTRKDEGEFQKKVLRIKLLREARARTDKLYVFERGIPDSIAYFEVAGLDSAPIKKHSNRYRKIFFLEPLKYEKDYARTESEAVRDKLNNMLMASYTGLGYEVVFVPALPVEARVKLVLSHFDKDL